MAQAQTYSFDTILATLPRLFERVWSEAISTRKELQAAFDDAGIAHPIVFRDDHSRVFYDLALEPVEDVEAAERRLRSAITRRTAKPSGSLKGWDLGSFEMSLRLVARPDDNFFLALIIQQHHSLQDIRAAARDWLDGMGGVSWLVKHRFIDAADAEVNERGFYARPATLATRSRARLHDDGRVTMSLHQDPGMRPAGVKSASDDEAYDNAKAFLFELLGDADEAPAYQGAKAKWVRGDREFSYRRMRSRSRSVDFWEKPRSA